jgi:U6 snRNA phosphodiesterase
LRALNCNFVAGSSRPGVLPSSWMKRTLSTTLVSYTDSSSENEQDTEPSTVVSPSPPPSKKRKLPPLAAHLAPAIPLDDPSKHQGRTRATPHVDGQWAAYVYVPILLRGTLRSIVERAFVIAKREATTVRVLGGSNPDSEDVADVRELHISLTRPFFLRAHQREEMKRVVRDTAKAHPP